MHRDINDVPMVVVSGPDGAGKSTLVGSLQRRFTAMGVKTAVASLWDLSAAPDLPRMFSGKEEAQRYLSRVSARSRFHFLLHHLCEALERARSTPGVELLLFDTYWYKYLAAEICHGGEPEQLIPAALELPQPSLILNLRVPEGITARRKEQFSLYESGMAAATAQNFILFQSRLRKTLQWVVEREPCPRLDLDAIRPAGEVLEQAFRCVLPFAPEVPTESA